MPWIAIGVLAGKICAKTRIGIKLDLYRFEASYSPYGRMTTEISV